MNELEEQGKEKSGLVAVRWIGNILSIAVMVYLLSKVGWRAIESFGQIPWWMFLVFILIGLTFKIATFGRWNSLLSASAEKMSWKDSLKADFCRLVCLQRFANHDRRGCRPTGWRDQAGGSGSLAAASLVVDRLIGMTGMTLMLPLRSVSCRYCKKTKPACRQWSGSAYLERSRHGS